MKWRSKESRRDDHDEWLLARGWHRHFAWLPLTIKGHVYWLTSVERRYVRRDYSDYAVTLGKRWFVEVTYREIAS